MTVPTDRKYTEGHEWLDVRDGIATVGITQYAADALGDIVYVDLPQTGARLRGGEVCGELESTKSVSELFAPADGQVTEVNEASAEDPSILNRDPFGRGWLFRMELRGDAPPLMDAGAYEQLLAGGA